MTVRTLLCFALPFALYACTVPQKINALQRDKAVFDRQQDERAAYERCTQNAVPGTPQHLACRMAGRN